MKRVLLRASQSASLQSQWKPIRVRFASADLDSCELVDGMNDAISNATRRSDLRKSLSRSDANDLFLKSKKLLALQKMFVTWNSERNAQFKKSEDTQLAFRQIWSSIMMRVINLCQSNQTRYRNLPPSIYGRFPVHRISLRLQDLEVDSKKAVYFLFFLSRAAELHLVEPSLIERCLVLLLTSITQKPKLSGDQLLSVIKSINTIIRNIQGNQTEEEISDYESGMIEMDQRNDIPSSLLEQDKIDNLMRLDERAAVATISLKTLIENVIRRCTHAICSSLTIQQSVPIARELALLDIYVPKLFDRIRNEVESCGILSIDTDTLLSVIEVWKLQGVRDRDLQIFHSIATEIMNNRLESQLTPRQICDFLYQCGSAKILFPYVFDRCFSFLLRLTENEKATLDWIVNRMFGRAIGSDGTWHAIPLSRHESDEPLNFQIGLRDSKIFVGSAYQLSCRIDAEACEWDFWNAVLKDQLSMKPETTLQRHPSATLSSILYPLFAMERFERVASEMEGESQNETATDNPVANGVTLKHPDDPLLTFSQLLIQTLEGLNSVFYYDELLIQPLSRLIAAASLRPKKDSAQSVKRRKTDFATLRKSDGDVVRFTGLSLLQNWTVSDFLSVFTAIVNSRVRVPPSAVKTITQRLMPHLHSLDGHQLSQLNENIAQSCRGVDYNYFIKVQETHSSLLSPSDQKIWDMSCHALACWVINLCTYAAPTVLYENSTDQSMCHQQHSLLFGWTASNSFQSCIEALAQKLLICFQVNRKPVDLPLVTHRVIQEFNWAGNELQMVIESDSSTVKAFPICKNEIHQDSDSYNINNHNWLLPYQRRNLQQFSLEIKDYHNNNPVNRFNAVASQSFDISNQHLTETQKGLSEITNYDLAVERHEGLPLKHAVVEQRKDLKDFYCYEISQSLFQLTWTAFLSYGLIADVWKVKKDEKQNPLIEVLDWESALRVKLEALPLKTVALIHDILTICESGSQPESNAGLEMRTAEELDRNPELRRQILLHVLRNGYAGVEPRFLCHASIMESIDENIRQNKLPPLPEELQRGIRKWLSEGNMKETIPKASVTNACVPNAPAPNGGVPNGYVPNARVPNRCVSNVCGENSEDPNGPVEWRSTETHRLSNTNSNNLPMDGDSVDGTHYKNFDPHNSHTMSHYQYIVYRSLNLMNRRLHRYLGCRRAAQSSEAPPGFVDTISVEPNASIGPLTANLLVQRVSKIQC